MKYYFIALSLALLLSVPVTANAESEGGIDRKNSNSKKIELGIHTGLANVKAREFVYSGSYKLSELIWDTKNVFMLGGDATITLMPSWGVKLNVSASTAINKAGSTMDDYDWMYIGADWTHWSHHDNTELQKGLVLDVALSANIYTNKSKTFFLDGLAGYKRDQWKWQAVGGTYIYSSAFPAFRDLSGSFANVPVISYEQTMNTPYLGMSMKWTEEYLTLDVKLIGSLFSSTKTVDHHFLRTLVITDTFKNGNMIGGDIDFTYHANENWDFNIFYSFQSYPENRGDASYFDQSTGVTTLFPNSAGMSLDYQTFGIGVAYSF